MVKKIGIGFGILIIFLVVMGYAIPAKKHIERSVVINASPEKIFEYLNDMEKFQLWSPWHEMEPSAKLNFSENRAGVGAFFTWEGKETGSGKMTVVESKPYEYVKTLLEFKDEGDAFADWKLVKEGDSTKIIWGFDGDAKMNVIGRYFNLLLEGFLGEQYESGLKKLKEICEK